MKAIYNIFMKRTSTYAVAIAASVFFFERGFDLVADGLFESHNKGVSEQADYLIKIFAQYRTFFRNCGRILRETTSKMADVRLEL